MSRLQRRSTVAVFALLIAVGPVWGQQFAGWQTPVNLGSAVNSPFGEFFPTVSKDGLSLYFTSPRNPEHPTDPATAKDWDIYVSERASVRDPWGAAQRLGSEINTDANEGAPSLSIDGHRLYFASNRTGGFGGNDIYVARRHDKRDNFGWDPAVNIGGGVNSNANDTNPAIVDDDATGGITLYFDSNRLGGLGPFADDGAHNGNDIYASALQSDETFGPAVMIEELSTPFFDRQPTVRRDGLEIFFSSNRTGSAALDLWVATRANTSQPWSTPVNVGSPLNTAGNEAGPALSFDGTTLYFQAVRPNDGSPFDLFVTTRAKLKGQRDRVPE